MPATNPGTTGLVAWWAHESGALTADSHGSLTLTNSGVTEGVAKVGTACGDYESGDPDYQYIADNDDLSFGDEELTIVAWAKAESTSSFNGIVTKGKNSSPYNGYYLRIVNGKFRMTAQSATDGSDANWASSVSTGTWYMVAGQHDPTANTVGVSVNAAAFTTAAHDTGILDSGQELAVGGDTSSYASRYFDGLLDEVSIWRRILTVDELAWLYNSGSGRSYADLTASAGNPLGLFAAQQRAMYAYGGVSVG